MTTPTVTETEEPRVDSFHRLGYSVPEGASPREAMEMAHMLNWNVRKLPLDGIKLLDTDGVYKTTTVPQKYAAVRTNPFTGEMEALGTVGRVWQPFQNEDSIDLLQDIVDESGGQVSTLGVLGEGRSTFISMKLPAHMEFISPIDGSKDVTDLYIALFNHHDGNGALKGVVTPLRISCANMQRMATETAKGSFSLRHTTSARVRLAEVRSVLNLTFKYRDTYVEQCQRLIGKQMDEDAVFAQVRAVFDVNEPEITERVKNARIQTSAKVLELYRTSPSVAPFKGTAYGVYNAVTEYADHYSKVSRKGDANGMRAVRSIADSWVNDLKGKAFTMLLPA